MTQLNETQVSVLNEILARDPEFRAVVQQRFQVEVDAATARANQLKDAVSLTPATEAPTTVAPAAPKAKPAKRGRPRGSVNGDGTNKMEAVRKVLAAHPGSQLQEIATHLEKAGVAIEGGMLSSYLYHLVSNEEVKKAGKRNSYTYTLKGAKRK
jgi:hypothetical protein